MNATAAATDDPAPFWASLAGDPRVRWGVTPADPLLNGISPAYLATPYSRRAMRDGAFCMMAAHGAAVDARRVLRIMTLAGITAISPIVQAQSVIADLWGDVDGAEAERRIAALALDADWWAAINQPLLNVTRGIYVPELTGWAESAGIMAEVRWVLGGNRPVMIGARAFGLEAG